MSDAPPEPLEEYEHLSVQSEQSINTTGKQDLKCGDNQMGKLAIANQNGNVNLTRGVLPKRYTHIRGPRLPLLCRSIGIRYCEAVCFKNAFPVKDGVVISARSAEKLKGAIAKRELRSARPRQLRQQAKALKRERHLACIASFTVEEAIVKGCLAMFHLNRAAKRSLGFTSRQTVYEMKNRWIQFLYSNGYCDRCEIHTVSYPARPCFTYARLDGESEGCYGNWGDARTKKFLLFSFLVDGIRYSWHQPSEFVFFQYQLTAPDPQEISFADRNPSIDTAQLGAEMELMQAYVATLQRAELIAIPRVIIPWYSML